MPEPIRHERYLFYRNNVRDFVRDVMCSEVGSFEDFIPGTQKIRFYGPRFDLDDEIRLEDLTNARGGISHEEAVYKRLRTPRQFNLLVLVGGLGAGKSTAVRYLMHLVKTRRADHVKCLCSGGCLREPVRVDCINIQRNETADEIYFRIFRSIRFEIYNRLIDDWLLRNELKPAEVKEIDGGYKVLRRLLLSNDIGAWADVEHPESYPAGLRVAELDLGENLLQINPDLDFIRFLVAEYREGAKLLDERLLRIGGNRAKSLDFAALLLQFFTHICGTGAQNLLVVDNLDQLPTARIEEIVQSVHDLASRVNGLPIVVPLRPSSITPHGFPRDIAYIYHYGPDCFEMVIRRLEKYVLGRSRDALVTGSDKLPACFRRRPTHEELAAFVTACYLYVAVAGEGIRNARGKEREVLLHDDFSYLRVLQPSPRAARNLSDTLGALVGTSCRYALEQLQRYFVNVYHAPDMLERAIVDLARPRGPKKLLIRYGPLASALVVDQERAGQVSRLANLYKPTKLGNNKGWPSLVKIRILALLAERKKVDVRSVVVSLAKYGIPIRITLAALNYLHRKERLLVWFSDNGELEMEGEGLERSLRQYVAISEHGLSYFRHVLGDFEYAWYCASQLGDQVPVPNFSVRLNEFVRLIHRLGTTEWKQITFRQSSAQTLADQSGRLNLGEFVTLAVLYSSVERILAGAESVLLPQRIDIDYKSDITSLVGELLREVSAWQERYQLCYGGTGFLHVYQDRIEACAAGLSRVLKAGALSPDLEGLANEMIEEWSAPARQFELSYETASTSVLPEEDLITATSRFARGMVPGLKTFVEALDQRELTRIYLWRFLKTREDLREVLEVRLPAYTEFSRFVRYLLADAEEVIETAKRTAATGAETLEWFVAERGWLQQCLDQLTENEYRVEGLPSYEQMDQYKQRANNVLALEEKTARHLGIVGTTHLAVVWA